MMSLALDEEAIRAMFDDVLPGLFGLILSKKIMREEHYTKLIKPTDDTEYTPAFWMESTTAHYNFVMICRVPLPPAWVQEGFFVLRVA